jgi:hypothetical protein
MDTQSDIRSATAPRPRNTRSSVTNGKRLFVINPGDNAWSRRYRDVLAEIVNDLGGPDVLSEAQRQLARRATSLSMACEKLECQLAGAPSDAVARFTAQAGGLSPHAILHEASRVLHGIAVKRGGDKLSELAALPDAQLDRVTDLLVKAGELAAKAIAAGSETTADFQLYGMLADRCGRTFQRLGLRRRPRDVSQINGFTPLRSRFAEADEAEGDKEATELTDISEVTPP